MNLDELLDIDPSDSTSRHAQALVEGDKRLLNTLVRIRKGADLSQNQVGERMNVSQSAVARIESGERDPRLSTLRRYALAVGALITHEAHAVSKDAPVRTRNVIWASDVALEWDTKLLVRSGGRRRQA